MKGNLTLSKYTNIVYTDPTLARKVVEHFAPQFKDTDSFLDPCRGSGAFYDVLPDNKAWCEIQQGKDFYEYRGQANWIITNPPWSPTELGKFAKHSFTVADNVVFLIRMKNMMGTESCITNFLLSDHNIKELCFIKWNEDTFKFADGSIKAKEGWLLGAIHFQKDFAGKRIITHLEPKAVRKSKTPLRDAWIAEQLDKAAE